MKRDIRVMLDIYKTNDVDWLGYKIYKDTPLTRHHIFKKVYGGPNDITNYALLIEKSHKYLHLLENTDHNSYIEINKLFKELNDTMNPPTEEYYNEINKILKRVKK